MLKRLLLLVSLGFAMVAMTKGFVGHDHVGTFGASMSRSRFKVESRGGSMVATTTRHRRSYTSITSFYRVLEARDFLSRLYDLNPWELEPDSFGFGWAYFVSSGIETISVAIPFWLLGSIWLVISIGLSIITRVRFSVRDMLVLTAVCAGSISLCHYNPMPVIALSVIALPLLAIVLFARYLIVPAYRLAAGRLAAGFDSK